MARGANQKLKLFYLAKTLQEQTVDPHGLTMPEIIRELNSYDIEADRKCLYDAICSSLFITARKSKELIEKMEKNLSNCDAKRMHREVLISGC